MTKGVVYTPDYWADWAASEFGMGERWAAGAVVLDPGCGRGGLLAAVVRNAAAAGFRPRTEDLGRLRGVETDSAALAEARTLLEGLCGAELPEGSLICEDYLSGKTPIAADLIFGNPPWVSFGDLADELKVRCRPLFRRSGLAPNPKDLLLGGARIDLSALFAATALNRDLKTGGRAYFFLPSSLFRSEGAHKAFRRLRFPGGRRFSLSEYRDIDAGPPFPGAGTRFCFVSYLADSRQIWPIPWHRLESDGAWNRLEASPAAEPGSPLVPRSAGSSPPPLPRISVAKGVRPRQGINTCGASSVFIFEEMDTLAGGLCRAVNRRGEEGVFRSDWIHPLMTPSCFGAPGGPGNPRRWIFVPYDRTGRVLSSEEIRESPESWEWLNRHRGRLVGRKGLWIRGLIDRGFWWGLLGAGGYSFSSWKIAWESYGRARFAPQLFRSVDGAAWQGNQALHCTLSFADSESARSTYRALQAPEVQSYLQRLGGAFTKGWAQPGRMRRILVENQ